MRLLHVVDRFGQGAGGGDLYLEELLVALRERAVESRVLCRDGNPARFDLADEVIALPGLMAFTGRARAARAGLAEVLHAWQPDTALVHCLPNPAFGQALATALPTVLIAHDYGAICPAATQWWRLPNAPCERTVGLPCLAHAYTKGCYTRRPRHLLSTYYHVAASRPWLQRARIMAISGYVKERFLAAGYRDEQVHVVWYPFATDVPAPPLADSGSPIILFVGRVSREKGVTHLLEALAPLANRAWRLLVAGDGPARGESEQFAADLGLRDRVEFAGWLEGARLEAAFARAALVAVPSLWPEPYGQVGPQAMLRGRPVVAYATGGIRDWLQHGVTGLAVPPADVAGLSSALGRLLADAAWRQTMGQQARARARQTLTLDRHLRGLAAVIASAIQAHGIAPSAARGAAASGSGQSVGAPSIAHVE